MTTDYKSQQTYAEQSRDFKDSSKTVKKETTTIPESVSELEETVSFLFDSVEGLEKGLQPFLNRNTLGQLATLNTDKKEEFRADILVGIERQIYKIRDITNNLNNLRHNLAV